MRISIIEKIINEKTIAKMIIVLIFIKIEKILIGCITLILEYLL